MNNDLEMIKIVIIGSSGTGKTNISTKYVNNQFLDNHKATVGVEFLCKVVNIHNQNIKITLWDTVGQEKYRSLNKVYFKGSLGVLIVYDVTDPESYLNVESWMRLANENLDLNEVVLMVVGNKIDLDEERKVPKNRPLKEYKDKFDIDCWEVSVKTGENIKELFSELIEKIYQMSMNYDSFKYDSFKYDYVGPVNTNSVDPYESINIGRISQPNNDCKEIPEVVFDEQESINMMKNRNGNQAQNTKPAKTQQQVPKEQLIQSNITLNNMKIQKKEKNGCC